MDRPTTGAPGDEELREMCANARRVNELCDLLGFEFRGHNHLQALLEGALKTGVSIADMSEDPDLRPYIWDLEEDS